MAWSKAGFGAEARASAEKYQATSKEIIVCEIIMYCHVFQIMLYFPNHFHQYLLGEPQVYLFCVGRHLQGKPDPSRAGR